MLRIINILIFILVFQFIGQTQVNYVKKYHFAVGLFVGPHSKLITYAIITESGDKIIGTQILREQSFMYFIMGFWPSKANPERLNLLELNEVDSCFLLKNSADKISGYFIKPFYDLWKIKYKIHPIDYDAKGGWSQEYYKPSPIQAKYIYKHYGCPNVKTSYIYGEGLYKLLRDIQKPDWQIMYQTLSDSI